MSAIPVTSERGTSGSGRTAILRSCATSEQGVELGDLVGHPRRETGFGAPVGNSLCRL